VHERDVNAVAALLREAQEHGIGLAFLPDDDGWEVLHIGLEWPAVSDQYGERMTGRLGYAHDLETACAAALRPLKDLGEDWNRYLAERADRQAERGP
jgi:hypothetical protein